MKKKTSSYSLSQDIYDEIEEYRIENRIATKSQALERMLLERRFMLQQGVGYRNEVPCVTEAPKPTATKPKKKESKIRNTINDIMDNMPD